MDTWTPEEYWPVIVGGILFVGAVCAAILTWLCFKDHHYGPFHFNCLFWKCGCCKFGVKRWDEEALITSHEEGQCGSDMSPRQENEALRAELQKVKVERDDYCRRLSEQISVKMRTNNPDIVNLDDQFRPTKLAEISSELYDNEWTNAFDVLEKIGFLDTDNIRILLDIVMAVYNICKEQVDTSWAIVEKWHLRDSQDPEVDKTRLWLRESRKALAVKFQSDISQMAVDVFTAEYGNNKDLREILYTAGPVRVYLDACVRLCLYMVVQDPPVVWYCPGWTSVRKNIDFSSSVSLNWVTEQTTPDNIGQFDNEAFGKACPGENDDAANAKVFCDKNIEGMDKVIGKDEVGDDSNTNDDTAVLSTNEGNDVDSKLVDADVVAGYGDNMKDCSKQPVTNEKPPKGLNQDITLQLSNDILEDIAIEQRENTERDHSKILYDKSRFKEYMQRGEFVEYFVWPAMCLNGNLLSKGVAQCFKNG